MIRRIGLAGAGMCAFLCSACMSTTNWGSAEPFWVDAKTGVAIPEVASATSTGNSTRLPGTTVARVGSPYNRNQPSVADGRTAPTFPRESDGTDSRATNDPPATTSGRMLPDLENPRSGTATRSSASPVGRRPDEASVITPPWPNLGGISPTETTSLTKQNTTAPDPAPTISPIEPTRPSFRSHPTAEPATLPPLEATRPVGGIERVSTAQVPDPVAADTILIKALRAFEKHRPEEAIRHLRQLDPTNQDVLMYLLPIMVRLSDTNAQPIPAEEVAALTDRLQQATLALKNKAAVRNGRICFCRAIRKFGDVDPYDPQHEFRPGDMVHLYVELKHFTCSTESAVTPASTGVGSARPGGERTGYTIWTETRLEIRDRQGQAMCQFDELPKKVRVETTTQDCYHTYRFCVPEKLPPGIYTLWVTVTDKNKPEGGGIHQAIELRVGRN